MLQLLTFPVSFVPSKERVFFNPNSFLHNVLCGNAQGKTKMFSVAVFEFLL